ncbi:MAG: hypothetical protein A2097_12130 [Desulfobacula sp. GWF2_41_7]|nr:MAG: hypothetical protein A2097_12130 [Desulfobacula sp. GWF2_41_7]
MIDVPVFFHKNIGGIVNITSLQGLTIGVKQGDACIEVLERNKITSLKKFNSYKEIIEAATEGRIKVFSIDKPPALYYLYKMNIENEFRYSLNLYTGKFHRAVKKGQTDTLKMVEGGFALITKKEHDAINKKWMGESLTRPEFFRYISFFLLFTGLIFSGLIFFNLTLRRKVRSKTSELLKTVNQLKLSEGLLKAIFEQAGVGVALCDAESGTYIKVNQKYCEIVGYTPEEMKEISFEKITHPEDLQKDLEKKNLLIEGKIREFSIEKRYCRKDGAIVWAKLTVSPLWKESEKTTSHIAIVEDITKNKQKENLQAAQLNLFEYAQTHSVKEMLQRFLDIAEALTDSEIGFYHFVDEDQKTVSLQTWSTNTLTNMCRAEKPEHQYPISKAGVWADCIYEKKPVIHNDYTNLLHKKGMPKNHAVIIREMVIPVIRGEKIMAILGVGNKKTGYENHDVEIIQQLADMIWETVSRKRAEEEITKREIFLNAIIENIPNMIFVKDATDLRFLRFNKAGEMLTGFSREELMNKTDYDVFTQNEADFFTNKDKEALRKGELLDIPEETIQTKKKETRILHTKKIPLLDQNGQPEYLLGISEDITERKHLEKQLRQIQKIEAIGTLAGGIAHDFNNILSGIFAYSQLAEKHIENPVKAKGHIDQIIQCAKRAAEMTRQILTYSRKKEQEKKLLDISIPVKEALQLMHSSLPSTIEIKESILSGTTILADPTQIHQIVMNLCANAYHAMRDTGGILDVKLNRIEIPDRNRVPDFHAVPGKYLMLEVNDTGHGMDEKILGKIFDPYFTTKEIGEGTGLGLSLVYGIVKELGGYIKVDSSLGKGSAFRLFFPIANIKETDENQKIHTRPLTKGIERVMLVDDEETILRPTQEILEACGYQVSIFSNGVQALDEFKKKPYQFDIIITDMTMPKMTGDKLAKELISIRPDIPVIICTGFSERIDKEKSEAIGIKGFLMKPVEISDLENLMRKVLSP